MIIPPDTNLTIKWGNHPGYPYPGFNFSTGSTINHNQYLPTMGSAFEVMLS